MLTTLVQKVFGSANDRQIKKYSKIVKQINEYESHFENLTEEDLKAYTPKLKRQVESGASLDQILPEAFALVREASKRSIGLRHFDVQMIGGMVLHHGRIAEMKTGEGKTLVATLAAYLNALAGKGVHIVTVNDYLAQRDSAWMGKVYGFLGLKVGCIINSMPDKERKEAYACDITYGTNNEFGFDYLRDNMKFRLEDRVMRPFHYAIVDEMDSILIDEARTPLIISGPAEDSSYLYTVANQVVQKLEASHYDKDEKSNNATLTEDGIELVETTLKDLDVLKGNSLYDVQNISCVHHINQALKANVLFKKDKDYIVQNQKVIIIDEFTGRMMEGRRYSDGLHQALEAKENVPIQMENQTLASITFQNYFRIYPKLSGMTGTAMTEREEFYEIYKLEVTELPTHQPCVRKDFDDEVYRTEREKFDAIIKLIKECQVKKQPILVGTASIEKSDKLSNELKRHHIVHQVLNARYHEKEAHIIAEAGKPGAVTIATNMAGRGTDIKLGGNLEARIRHEVDATLSNDKQSERIQQITQEIIKDEETVKQAGGLYIIGTERHESRRIDNQLRGRAGRQGDPGASKFFLSLEDDLMRIFGSERLNSMLEKLGLEEGEAITHPWVNKAIERAQKKVEARNYDIRKHLLKYDDVMNEQRKVVYQQRLEIMQCSDEHDIVASMREETVETLVHQFVPEKAYQDQWDISSLEEEVHRIFNLKLPIKEWSQEEGVGHHEILERLQHHLKSYMDEKFSKIDANNLEMIEKAVLLRVLDQSWKDHLLSLDHLRQGINLRAYAQRDPLNEYKKEAFEMFEEMLVRLREGVTKILCHFEFSEQTEAEQLKPEETALYKETRTDPALGEEDEKVKTLIKRKKATESIRPNAPETWGRVSRNEPCPCGSGKKYKHCHGQL